LVYTLTRAVKQRQAAFFIARACFKPSDYVVPKHVLFLFFGEHSPSHFQPCFSTGELSVFAAFPL
jgi:hypothetical protein